MNYASYDVDLTGATFVDILTQTDHILADNAGFLQFASRNSNALKMGGLKDMKVYRTIFNTRFLEGKTPAQRAYFLALIAATSVVQTKSRVTRVLRGLDSNDLKTGAAALLTHFRDNRAQTNDIDTFLVINLRTAYPEIVILVRMVNTELQGNYTFDDETGAHVTVPEWFCSSCAGQLALDGATQTTHRMYMRHFWTEQVTGAGAGWDTSSDDWYNRTSRTDLMTLPTIGTVIPGMTGQNEAGTNNTRYTMTDLTNYAAAINAAVNGMPVLAAAHTFGQD